MLLRDKKCPNCDAYYDPTLEKCPRCYKHNDLYLDGLIPRHQVFLHPIAQIGLFIGGFAYAGMMIASILVGLFAQNISDKNLFEGVSITATYSLMFIGLALIVLLTRRKSFLAQYKNGIDYIYGLAYAITIVLVGSLVSTLLSLFHTFEDNINQSNAVSFSNNYPILAFFVLGFLGPICEELTYRVGLFSFLRRINKYLAFIVTTLVFAFIHFSFGKDVDIVNELWSLPIYIVSGFILTLAYEHRGPACSMTAHILYNIFSFIMILAA